MYVSSAQDRPFFPSLLEYITSGPVVAMCWEGPDAVAIGRAMLGPTNPSAAAPGTIRGDFGLRPGRNVVHGSDSPANGARETDLWFGEGDLVDWDACRQSWVVDE